MEENKKYFDPTNTIIKQIDRETAKKFIEKHHYSHKISLFKVAYGLFQITNIPNLFFDDFEEKLLGVCIFSQTSGRSAAESISPLIKINELFELIRLACLEECGTNCESFFISKCLKLLKKDFPNIKAVLSYSDTEQNHIGGIYKATNFLFLGLNSDSNLMPNFSISIDGPPDYNWIHSRSAFSKWGSHNILHLKRRIQKSFWRKKEAGKNKYLYILTDKKMKREILKTLKMKVLPYPKICDYKENIEKIEVNDTTQENQFIY